MTDDPNIARALARAAVYRVLGGAFVPPTPARLGELARAASTAAGAFSTPLGDALARFAGAAREADAGALAAEHVFLFGRQVRCSPYESAWSGLSPMAGKSARLADVAGFYAAFGLGRAEAQPDVEDHIGAELEFMSALAVKEAWALAEGHGDGVEVTRSAQAKFLAEHLGRWAEAFAEALGAASPLPFYAAVAGLLVAWVRAEAEALGVTPERVSVPDERDAVEAEESFTCPMAPPE